VFLGVHSHTLDDKGRVMIPSRFREELGERFIITRGLDHCLFVFPTPEWQKLAEKISLLPFTKADARAFTRILFSGAHECELDKQGRALIPPVLREYARLVKNVEIIGVQGRVEIWSSEEWRHYVESSAASYEELAEKLGIS